MSIAIRMPPDYRSYGAYAVTISRTIVQRPPSRVSPGRWAATGDGINYCWYELRHEQGAFILCTTLMFAGAVIVAMAPEPKQ